MIFKNRHLKNEKVTTPSGDEVTLYELPADSYYRYTDEVFGVIGNDDKVLKVDDSDKGSESSESKYVKTIDFMELKYSLIAYSLEPGVEESYEDIVLEVRQLSRADIEVLHSVANRLYMGGEDEKK